MMIFLLMMMPMHSVKIPSTVKNLIQIHSEAMNLKTRMTSRFSMKAFLMTITAVKIMKLRKILYQRRGKSHLFF